MNLQKFGKIIRKNRSLILSGIGIGGFVYASYDLYKLGKKQETKWTKFIKPIAIELLSAASILTGNILDRKEKTAIMGAFAAADYLRRKAVGLDIPETEQKMVDEIVSDSGAEFYDFVTEYGPDTPLMFYDPVSETIFNSTLRTIIMATYMANHQLTTMGYLDAKDWLWLIGIEVTENDDKISELGWSSGLAETWFGQPFVDFWPEKNIHDGIETIDIHMSYYPKADYYDY